MAEKSPIKVQVEGLDEAVADLKQLAARLPDAADRVIEDSGEAIFANSQRLVPVDTGTLQRSGSHQHKRLQSEVGYNAPYAGFVHDGTSKMPPRPFLRAAVEMELPKISKRILDESKK